MYTLFEYGTDLFCLFIFPLIGLGFDYFVSKKKRLYAFGISLLLLSPILTGYSYRIDYLYQIFGIITLGSIYSFYSTQIEKKITKIITAVIISLLLLIILGFAAFMDAFSGSQTIEKKWKVDNYKVEYIIDQGFSGRPLLKYELSKFTLIPIFEKKIETTVEKDTVDNCKIYFKKSNLTFNECDGTFIEK